MRIILFVCKLLLLRCHGLLVQDLLCGTWRIIVSSYQSLSVLWSVVNFLVYMTTSGSVFQFAIEKLNTLMNFMSYHVLLQLISRSLCTVVELSFNFQLISFLS